MQIKTIVRYRLTPVRNTIIKKSTNNKCWRGCGEKGTLLNCLWEYKLIQPLWKTVWGFLKKLIPLLGIYPEETKIEKEYLLKFIVMTSLVVQRLRLCTPNAGGRDSIPGQGTRSHMLRLKPSAAKKPDKPKFHSCVPHLPPRNISHL